jgi:hypothetical protein
MEPGNRPRPCTYCRRPHRALEAVHATLASGHAFEAQLTQPRSGGGPRPHAYPPDRSATDTNLSALRGYPKPAPVPKQHRLNNQPQPLTELRNRPTPWPAAVARTSALRLSTAPAGRHTLEAQLAQRNRHGHESRVHAAPLPRLVSSVRRIRAARILHRAGPNAFHPDERRRKIHGEPNNIANPAPALSPRCVDTPPRAAHPHTDLTDPRSGQQRAARWSGRRG